MELTCWGHSGIRIARDGAVLVIDPGTFTDQAILEGAGAVLITHEHPDHVVPERLADALADRPDVPVWAPEPVPARLIEAGLSAEQTHVAEPGESFVAAGFGVHALGLSHAVIHPAIPAPANRAYLIEGAVLHPGDSFTPPPAGTALHALLLPVAAPWMKLAEAVDYLQAVQPEVVVPIHDAMLTDAGRALSDRILGGLSASALYRRLTPGETLTVPVP